MPTVIQLTEGSVTVTGATTSLAINRAVPVDQYDEIDVDIWIQGLVGAPKLDLFVGMQNTFDDLGVANPSWVPVMVQLAPVNTGHYIVHLPGPAMYMLQYLRWRVTAIVGETMTFTISGIARRKSF